MITSAAAAIATSLAVTACALVWAAVSDFLHYIIPNRTPIIVMIAYAVTACFMPVPFVLGGLVTGLATFSIGFFLFAKGWMGGGDVKFMAATSLWLGWPVLAGYLLWVAIAGGGLALVILAFRRLPLRAGWAERPWLARLHRAEQGLPYGIALGLGGLVMLRPAVASVFPG